MKKSSVLTLLFCVELLTGVCLTSAGHPLLGGNFLAAAAAFFLSALLTGAHSGGEGGSE